MNLSLSTTNKEKFLDLMDDLGAHSTFFIDYIAEELSKCGLPASIDTHSNFLLIGDTRIFLTQPEWGSPGIHPTDVLLAIIKHFGFEIDSNMTGKGFYHKDLLEKLAKAWGIDKRYL
jgi:hypothetical protein